MQHIQFIHSCRGKCVYSRNMSCFKLKSLVFFLKILISIVLSRNFGNIIHNIPHKSKIVFNKQKYININVSDLRKLQKLHIKLNKAHLGINFLTNCKNFGVFPKFFNVYLPNVQEKDMYGIKKKLQQNAIDNRI